jgi:hypothetical protein
VTVILYGATSDGGLAELIHLFKTALCTFLSPQFKDFTKSIRSKLRSVSGIFVRIGDPYLCGRFHVLISSWSEEIRELTMSDTFDEYESLVVRVRVSSLQSY